MNQSFSDAAYNALNQLNTTLKNCKIEIPDEVVYFATSKTLFQHGQHIKVHHVNQTSVDPYKIVCWYGFSIINVLELDPQEIEEDLEYVRSIGRAMISTLEGFLNTESHGKIIFPQRTRNFLLQLIEEEQKGNGDHGIGKNGLYAAFHCAVATLRCIENPDERLKHL